MILAFRQRLDDVYARHQKFRHLFPTPLRRAWFPLMRPWRYCSAWLSVATHVSRPNLPATGGQREELGRCWENSEFSNWELRLPDPPSWPFLGRSVLACPNLESGGPDAGSQPAPHLPGCSQRSSPCPLRKGSNGSFTEDAAPWHRPVAIRSVWGLASHPSTMLPKSS